jgi:hypothetical protein
MAVYPTLYENNEGQVVRGPDIGGWHWRVAEKKLSKLKQLGELPEHAQLVGEYDVDPEELIETGIFNYRFLGVPWEPE